MVALGLSIVMPTCGRPTLPAAVASVTSQLAPEDELLVVGDGYLPHARAVAASADRDSEGAVTYTDAVISESRFGNAQRDRGIELASGSHLCFLDDDDIYEPGALDLIRDAVAGAAHAVHVFRARWGAGHHAHGTVLWRDPVWRKGNVGTPMVVIPRPTVQPLPRWMDFNHLGEVSDFGWLTAALGYSRIVWHEQIVATVRPVAREAAA